MRPLLLASGSPRRKALLEWLGIPFKVIRVPGQLEAHRPRESPEALVRRLAREKAHAVARCFSGHWVLGADTVVAIGRRILGKPANPHEAFKALRLLLGRTHRVLTGVALYEPGGRIGMTHVEKSFVTFRKLHPRQIRAYLRTREPYDKAGGYAIQGTAAGWVTRLRGDYFNVVGLPVPWLAGWFYGKRGVLR